MTVPWVFYREARHGVQNKWSVLTCDGFSQLVLGTHTFPTFPWVSNFSLRGTWYLPGFTFRWLSPTKVLNNNGPKTQPWSTAIIISDHAL